MFRLVMKLHDFDTPLPSHRDCGRRLHLVFVEEIPDEDTLFDMATMIAIHINSSPEVAPKQSVLPPQRSDFIMATDKTFVEVLGNRQACQLAMEIFAKSGLDQFFADHPAVVPAFWMKGTMDINIARILNLPLECVRPADLQDSKEEEN